MSKEKAREYFVKGCNEYLRLFCEKHDYDYEEDDDYIKPSSKPSKTETKPAETTKKPNPSTGAEPTGIYRFFALSSLMAFSLLVSKKTQF